MNGATLSMRRWPQLLGIAVVLGLVAFAMMTGKLPFPAETVQESMIARLTDRPKPLAEMKP